MNEFLKCYAAVLIGYGTIVVGKFVFKFLCEMCEEEVNRVCGPIDKTIEKLKQP